MRAHVRPVRYEDLLDFGCNFYGDDKNTVEHFGNWTFTTAFCPPSTSWSWCDTAKQTPHAIGLPADIAADTPDAMEVRIRLTNLVEHPTTGVRQSVLVDRARIKWDFT